MKLQITKKKLNVYILLYFLFLPTCPSIFFFFLSDLTSDHDYKALLPFRKLCSKWAENMTEWSLPSDNLQSVEDTNPN